MHPCSQAAATSRWQANQMEPPGHAPVCHPVGSKCHPQGGTEAVSAVCLQSLSCPHVVSLFLRTSPAPLLSVRSHGVYLDAPARPQLRAPLSRALRRELRKQPHRAWTPPSRSFSRRSPARGLGCAPRRADRQISGTDAGAPPRSPSLWAIKPPAKASPSPTPSTAPP